MIIDHVRQVIGGKTVGFHQNLVVDTIDVKFKFTSEQVLKLHGTRSRHFQTHNVFGVCR